MEPPPAMREADPSYMISMKKILIVGNDTVLRANRSELIRSQDFEVIKAKDALTGVRLTLQMKPDLILCDTSVSNLNGFAFYQTIQQIKSASAIPLIFLTTSAGEKRLRDGLPPEAETCISRPLHSEELLSVIRTRLALPERVAHEVEERFLALINDSAFGVFIYQYGKFIYLNKALFGMLGYNPDSANLSDFQNFIVENHRQKVFDELERCLNGSKSSLRIKSRVEHKTGIKITVEVFGSILTYQGVSSVIGHIIRSEKELKEQPPRTYKVKSSNGLTNRELDVLRLICSGSTTLEISKKLFISERTVETHRSEILSKTQCKNVAEIVFYALRNKLISNE
jgi:PAS domain S-box-containing protein